MNDLAQVTVYLGTAATVNAMDKVSKQADPVPGIAASALLLGVFGVMGSLWRWDVVKVLAGVMLLAALFTRGIPLLNTIGDLAGSLTTGRQALANAGTPQAQATQGGSKGGVVSAGGGGGGGGGGW